MDALTHNLSQLWISDELKERLLAHECSDAVQIEMFGGGKFRMKFNGKDMYHPEQPVALAAAEVQRLQGDAEQDMVVFFGLGMGLHAEFLKKRFNAPLLIFEPNLDILKTVLSLRPFLLKDTYVLHNYGRLMELMDRLLEPSDRRIIAASHSFYRESFPSEFKRFHFTVEQSAKNVVIRQNTLQKGGLWAEYEITNLKQVLMSPSILGLAKKCTNIPGIFVGAGPSLSKNIEYLRRAKGRAFIIAASTALRSMEQAGFIPDAAIVIESNDHRYQFEGLKRQHDLSIVATPYSNPHHYALPVKHTYAVLTHPSPVHDWMMRAYGNADSVPVGGSVALVGFSVLHRMGCDPIVAVGMDLAYTGFQTHVAGADSASVETRYNKETDRLEAIAVKENPKFFQRDVAVGEKLGEQKAIRCDAWGGKDEVFTEEVFNSYRCWLEGAAETWASSRTLINATEGGARIHGFEEQTLADVLQQYCQNQYPIEQWVDELEADFVPPDTALLRSAVADELALIREVNGLSVRCGQIAARIIASVQNNKVSRANRDLDTLSALEKEMGALSTQTRLLNQITQQAATIIRLGRHEDKHPDERIQMVNSLRRSMRLFSKIQEGSEKATELFERALTILA